VKSDGLIYSAATLEAPQVTFSLPLESTCNTATSPLSYVWSAELYLAPTGKIPIEPIAALSKGTATLAILATFTLSVTVVQPPVTEVITLYAAVSEVHVVAFTQNINHVL